MTRDKLTRYGCDGCKVVDASTYHFDRYGEVKLWLCETCLARLLDWPTPPTEAG